MGWSFKMNAPVVGFLSFVWKKTSIANQFHFNDFKIVNISFELFQMNSFLFIWKIWIFFSFALLFLCQKLCRFFVSVYQKRFLKRKMRNNFWIIFMWKCVELNMPLIDCFWNLQEPCMNQGIFFLSELSFSLAYFTMLHVVNIRRRRLVNVKLIVRILNVNESMKNIWIKPHSMFFTLRRH